MMHHYFLLKSYIGKRFAKILISREMEFAKITNNSEFTVGLELTIFKVSSELPHSGSPIVGTI